MALRDIEVIKRDVQIAELQASVLAMQGENTMLKAELVRFRAEAEFHALAAKQREVVDGKATFEMELKLAMREASPAPGGTPASGEPLRIVRPEDDGEAAAA